jgi:hypothetical protein
MSSGRLLFLGGDIGGTGRMTGEVAGEGAGSVLMFVLTSRVGPREFIRNRTIRAISGMIVSSRITTTPSGVNLR